MIRKLSTSACTRKLMTRIRSHKTTITKERKKLRVYDEMDVERRLFRMFRLRCKRDLSFHFDKFYAKLLRLVKVWRCSTKLKRRLTRAWLADWCVKYGVVDENKQVVNEEQQSILSTVPECASGIEKSDLENTLVDYSENEIYLFFCFHFRWSSLPDRTLGAEINKVAENVWLLMAANRSGRHRTRVCVLGKESRPACLKHVNMLSQPVAYAGFEGERITPDLFAWWFYHEFTPGALAINHKVALLVEAGARIACDKFVSDDTRTRFLLIGNTKNFESEINTVHVEFRVRYAKLFLSLMQEEEAHRSCQTFISRCTLKDVFPLVHKAWLSIRMETFERRYNELLLVTCCGQAERTLSSIYNEDGKLLLELQWIAYDLGLEISDQDLVKWAYTGEVRSASVTDIEDREVEREMRNSIVVAVERVPTAQDAVTYLTKVLAWMETEPFDPHFLLFIRHLLALAKQARYVISMTYDRLR